MFSSHSNNTHKQSFFSGKQGAGLQSVLFSALTIFLSYV